MRATEAPRAAWIRPVPQPAGTKYGEAGPMWSSGFHTGLDFPAPTGQAVAATAAGRVTYAGVNGAYGLMVKVTHKAGLETWYCHLSAVAVARGTIVAAGDQLGAVGESGNTTGPHLHLEVRRDGLAVDPAPYLSGSVDAGGTSSPTFPAGGTVEQAGLVDGLGAGIRPLLLMALFTAAGVALVALGAARAAEPAVSAAKQQLTDKATQAAQIAAAVHPAGRAAAGALALKGNS